MISRAFRISLLLGLVALAPPAVGGETPKVGDEAPAFELETLDGGQVKLATLVEKGPVVLAVLRGYPGYQCPLCTRQVAELVGKAKAFRDAKAQVVLVYPGPADGLKARADEFLKGKDLPEGFRLALDPDDRFLKSYGLRWDAPMETSYPSTFVIDAKGKVRFAKVSRSHGDRAATADVIEALGRR